MILDSADPISTVKAYHISRSSVDRVPIGVRELMGSISVGDSDFFFIFPKYYYGFVILIISDFY